MADRNVALVFPSQAPDSRTLDMVCTLADAMSSLDLTDVAWGQTATFLEHATDLEEDSSALKEAFSSVSRAWLACVEALQLDAAKFLDGCEHEATGLEALRKRAQEARDGQDSLLSWSVYQRARLAVQDSHAAPILTALDEHRHVGNEVERGLRVGVVSVPRGSRVSSTPGTQRAQQLAAGQPPRRVSGP